MSVLPIEKHLGEVGSLLDSHNFLILTADPGTGKTTLIPPHLCEKLPGKIIVLEPRRLAAKLSAERIAKNIGSDLGERVGFHIRGEKALSKDTKLIFMTEGMLAQYIKNDPLLKGVSGVILDEFHERNIHSDIALILVREITRKRPELKTVIMSATLDPKPLLNYLEDSTHLHVPGVTFPVETSYLPPVKSAEYLSKLEGAIEKSLSLTSEGNILVFLTGMADINRARETLSKSKAASSFEILRLSATVPKNEQNQCFKKSSKRKIILSTNVAETSLTLDDIKVVIDCGYEKRSSFAPWSGFSTLDICKISQASATQRQGRAGRTSNGYCIRLYSDSDYRGRARYTDTELERSDLSYPLILMLSLGTKLKPSDLTSSQSSFWLTPPPARHLEQSTELLRNLKAIDRDLKLTPRGQEISKLSLHPRLSTFILSGDSDKRADLTLASLIIEQGGILNYGYEPGKIHNCDLALHKEVFVAVLDDQKLPHEMRKSAVNMKAFSEVKRNFELLSHSLETSLSQITRGETDDGYFTPHLLEAYPDHIAFYRNNLKKKGHRLYNFILGRGGQLSHASSLKASEFIVCISATEKLGARDASQATTITMASSISFEDIDRLTSPLKTVKTEKVKQQDGSITELTNHYIGSLVYKSEKAKGSSLSPEEFIQEVTSHWRDIFEDPEAIDLYNEKINLADTYTVNHNFEKLEGEYLDLFFHSICDQAETLSALKDKKLSTWIMEELSYDDQQAFKSMFPESLKLENGKSFHVTYELSTQPSLSSLHQDFYGLKKHPTLLGGRLKLRCILLAPNHRPAQTTSDLPGYFSGSYEIVRGELKRRYPKHYWPDAPERAKPVLLKKHAEQT